MPYSVTSPIRARFVGRTWYADALQHGRTVFHKVPVCWADQATWADGVYTLRLWFKTPEQVHEYLTRGQHLAFINRAKTIKAEGEREIREAGEFSGLYAVVPNALSLEQRHDGFTLLAAATHRMG